MSCRAKSNAKSVFARWGIILALLLGGGAEKAAAETRRIHFDHLGVDEGLPRGAIRAIYQDRLGFLWFGTDRGLARFDGRHFVLHRHDDREPRSLSHDEVWAIQEDGEGRLWVATYGGGLNRWDEWSDSFLSFRHDPFQPQSLSDDRITALALGRRGDFWIGTEGGGLNRFDPASESWTRIAEGEQGLRIDTILERRDGSIWLGTAGGGLLHFDPRVGRLVRHRHEPGNPGSLTSDRVTALLEDHQRRLWVGTAAGLNRLDPSETSYTHFLHGSSGQGRSGSTRIRFLFEDAEQTLWVGTEAGLEEWRPDGESFSSYRHRPDDAGSLIDDRLTTMYQDRGGVLWIGTAGRGVDRFNPTLGTAFFHSVVGGAEPVTAFAEDARGRLWLAGSGTLRRWERSLPQAENRDATLDVGDRATSLLVDRRGRLWAGLKKGGVRRFDAGAQEPNVFDHDSRRGSSLGPGSVTAMLEDRAGRIWIGLDGGGVDLFHPDSGNFEHHRSRPEDRRRLLSDRVLCLYEDSDGNFWVGTAGAGLHHFDRDERRFTAYVPDPGSPHGLSQGVIAAMEEDSQGRLWIATLGGIDRWDRKDRAAGAGIFHHYGEAEGLPSERVDTVLLDGEGRIWVVTHDGPARLDTTGERFETYAALAGLGARADGGKAHALASGEIVIASSGGLVTFEPGEIQPNRRPPALVLTDWLVDHRSTRLPEPVSTVERIEVGHRARSLTFQVAALDFTAPLKNRLVYRLRGFEEDWRGLEPGQPMTFTNLDPGEYRLEVKAANGDGVWTEEELAVALRVHPPPWRSGWAYLLYAGVFLLVVRLSLRRRLENQSRWERRTRKLEAQTDRLRRELDEAARARTEMELRASASDRRELLAGAKGELDIDTPEYLLMLVEVAGFQSGSKADAAAGTRETERLREICELLRACCRESEAVLHWRGDVFLVAARHVDRGFAEIIAERIRTAVARAPGLTCAIGFALHPFLHCRPSALGSEDVVAVAELALDVVRASGGEGWAGIYGTSGTPAVPDLLPVLRSRLPELASDGAVELACSLPEDHRWVLACPRADRDDIADDDGEEAPVGTFTR